MSCSANHKKIKGVYELIMNIYFKNTFQLEKILLKKFLKIIQIGVHSNVFRVYGKRYLFCT